MGAPQPPAGSGEKPEGSQADHRAIAAAATLFLFLLLTKLSLLLWYLLVRHVNPLADVPPARVWLVVGGDALLFVCAAVLFLGLRWLGSTHRLLRFPVGRLLPALVYGGIVVFTVVSFEVTRIYGAPLDVQKLRSADDLLVIRDSIQAYAAPLPIALLLVGIAAYPFVVPRLARRLARRERLRGGRVWAAVAFACVMIAWLEHTWLYRIDTRGVKDDAVVFFARSYRPPFRPVDAGPLLAQLEARVNGQETQAERPGSLCVAGGEIPRDYPRPTDAEGFNVIFIQMESTSALHLDRTSAPNVTALADHGLSFTRHTTTFTESSRATYPVYYSDYLPDLGTTPRLLYGRPMPQPSVAEVFKAAGYHTALFETGFLGYLDIRFQFQDKGFDTLVSAREMLAEGAELASPSGVWEERTVDEMSDWIAAHRREKFFAAYLTLSPHHPYFCPLEHKPFPGDSWVDRYRNSLYYADTGVGRLVASLKKLGLFDRTLIVVFGDHGETVSTYPVGHGLNLSLEEMRTPFILSNPVLFPSPLVSRIPTSHLDIAPVVTRLVGLTPPAEWLGRDLLADRIPARMQFVTIYHVNKVALIDNDLLCAFDASGNRTGLYDTGNGAMTPLLADDPRWGLAPAYERTYELYQAWNVEHHLRRALAKGDKQSWHASEESIVK